MALKSKDKIFLMPLIIVLLIAVYTISNYTQFEVDLKKMRGAEWIAYDSEGRLYFTYYDKVYRLSSDNTSLEKIIETGLKISSRDIMDIALAPSGEVFLTDPTSSEIKVYSSNGVPRYRLKGHFKENARIAVDNERIYIADMQGNRTLAIDINKGELLWTDSNYRIPDSIFVKNSVVYVSDKDIKAVRMLNARDGKVINNIHMDFSGFIYGSAILVLDDDTILLAPAYKPNGTLLKYSQDGTLIQEINVSDGFTPVDMAISPEGKVLITDDENYSFYSVNNGIVELVKFKGVEQLFGNMQRERTSLKKSAFNAKLILVACVLFLIVLYVIYKQYANRVIVSHGIQGDKYVCRCGIHDDETSFNLSDDYLNISRTDKLAKHIYYTDILRVHLRHAPSKHIWDAYVCKIIMRNGDSLELCNKSYEGIFSIKDKSQEYVSFVKEFHKKLYSKNQRVHYSGGLQSKSDYIGFIFGFTFFIGLAIALLIYGKHGVVVGLIIPISWLFWLTVTFIKNRPIKYKPLDIPLRLLPKSK